MIWLPGGKRRPEDQTESAILRRNGEGEGDGESGGEGDHSLPTDSEGDFR
jgi:hypothetical protein